MELSVQCKKLEKGQNKLEKTIKTNKDKDTNRLIQKTDINITTIIM